MPRRLRYLAATDRTGIRRLSAQDQDEFCRAARASVSLHQPWLSPPTTPTGFEGFLRRARAADSERFAVHAVESGALAGYVVINGIIRRDMWSGAIGYGAFRPHDGRGHLSEGVHLVVSYAFDVLGLHRVEALIRPENAPSRKLVQGLGFTCEGLSPGLLLHDGQWLDHERWALRAEMTGRTWAPASDA